jgi:hypothetical protein
MAITSAICNSYKEEILEGVHASADTYKVALYTDAATLGASTTVFSVTNEVSGTGYTSGGATLTGLTTGLSSSTAFLTFSDPAFSEFHNHRSRMFDLQLEQVEQGRGGF